MYVHMYIYNKLGQHHQLWGVGAERSTRGGEMLPTRATVWRASGMRGDEAGRFREVEGVSIVADLYNLNNT